MEYFQSEYETKPVFRFSEMVQWINMNIGRQLSVSDIADTFGYTPNYLSDLFRNKTGYSLIRYINRMRMEKAKEKLLSSTKTIEEIAHEVADQQPEIFPAHFQTVYGPHATKMKNAWTDAHLNNR